MPCLELNIFIFKNSLFFMTFSVVTQNSILVVVLFQHIIYNEFIKLINALKVPCF